MKRKKHHKMRKDLISIVFMFQILYACNSNLHPFNENKGLTREQNKDIGLFIKQWKTDSVGCERLRTKEKAEAIIDSLKLEGTGKNGFEKVFGNANKVQERNGDFILGYYFDAICANGKLVDSADYCIAEFTFNKDKLTRRNYICQ
jgi:hypothetical protein